jgi:pectate lyase
MMKRIFSCFFLVLSLMMVNAQQDEVNSFQQSENQATGNASGANGSIGDSQVQSVQVTLLVMKKFLLMIIYQY